jgi:DNA-directed RNA polymerase subunit RPC12/RpoP
MRPRVPFRVHCVGCGHSWVGALLPMPLHMLYRLLRGLRCPSCGHGADHIIADGAALAVLESVIELPAAEEEPRLIAGKTTWDQ